MTLFQLNPHIKACSNKIKVIRIDWQRSPDEKSKQEQIFVLLQ